MNAMMAHNRLRRAGGRGGFTLIEILVVVALIIILVGAVIAVGAWVRQSSQRRATVVTLTELDGMLKRYKELNNDNVPGTGTTTFVTEFKKVPDLNRQLAAMPAGTFNGTNVLDGFGNPIQFVTSPREGFQSAGPNGSMGTVANPDPDDMFSWDPKN